MEEEIKKLQRSTEQQLNEIKTQLQKTQEERVHLLGLEQRLRSEFQTQVQSQKMANEEQRVRIEAMQNGFVQLRATDKKVKQKL
mmetsp:Transcript_46736/g.73164  ORF Transcript_46736/g.73164 Transcript_46736/m.73164 type:complete len:84 (+) Transcript_46736:226-477(+)|eukprot:CAMPEP_0184311432 /NCGR_PEP_ID=MMETSP1049-20130417/41893_1 /TAXON_ID=77928 /ORGANISM="Proteomonas sulcata, Strain CCMP704" /LENGTH=83 /DNA_ID=CAMNT_0026626803 /DNA_START=89 /DNA_END=340 /DNA_ORIENTATION=-